MLENIFRSLWTIAVGLATRAEELWNWLSKPIHIPIVGDISVLGLLGGGGIIILFTWWILKGVFL